MNELKGGNICGCGCCYAGQPGGSSSSANLAANAKSGYYSPGCENAYTPYTKKEINNEIVCSLY